MRIGILLHPYDEDKPAGLGRFIFELSKHLIEQDTKNDYILFVKKKPRKHPAILGENWKMEVLGDSPIWLGSGFRRVTRADMYIFNTPILPLLLPKAKSIVIALDFAYRYLPTENFRDLIHRKILAWYHGYSLKKADHIVSMSRATQNEILKLYGISGKKITVIYPGFNKICELKEEHITVPEKFFLFVGVLKERKNPFRVIQSFIQFHKHHPDFKLVMAGKGGGPYFEKMQNYIREHGAEEAILFTGFITDGQLSYLYKHAYAFVFPSIFEGGFCLPVLEAMHCGVPTITSGQGPFESMEETTGDAALLVNPSRVDEIADAMKRMVTENGLRGALIQKGFARAEKFSWGKSARELREVISKI